MTGMPLKDRYALILCLIALFSLLYHLVILYPPYGSGLPSGFDNYVHAGVAYSLAENGFMISPTSIYPAFFHFSLAFLYVVTGVTPIELMAPYGIAIDVLSIFPMFYIATRICDGNKNIGLLTAFLKAIDPVTFSLVCLGLIPLLLGLFWLLLLISVLLSGIGNKPIGMILMGILTTLIFFTHLLVSAFYLFLVLMILIHELVLKRGIHYAKPLVGSLLIAAVPVGLYYVPRLPYFSLSMTAGPAYFFWTIGEFIITPVLALPGILFVKRNSKKQYISDKSPHLTFLKLWYLGPIILSLAFIWQASIVGRMWELLSLPALVVFAATLVEGLTVMKKARGRKTAKVVAVAILTACTLTTFTIGALQFGLSFYATPPRLELTNWISSATPSEARICTEEESPPTHLGWYIGGLTGRTAYESLSNFSAIFEVGSQATLEIELARNITSLPVGSGYWTEAVQSLNVSYVVLLTNKTHPNFEGISSDIVFNNGYYVVYNITEFTLS